MARKEKAVKRPTWALTKRGLAKWDNTHGLVFLHGHQAQVVLADHGDPVFVLVQTPYLLTKNGRNVVGTFLLEFLEEQQRSWLMGAYVRALRAFWVELKTEDSALLIRHPELARYVDAFESDKIKQALEGQEGRTTWQASEEKVESRSWPLLGWELISSSRDGAGAGREPLLPQSLRLPQ
jgi:hypothetical protein